MNRKEMPQLFVAADASKWNNPKNFPFTMGWQHHYRTEAKIYAADILKNRPNAKVAVLDQNDFYRKAYLNGLDEGLGDKAAKTIVKEVSYENTDPTADSQIVALKASGADVFFNITTTKSAAMAIRKAFDIDVHPLQYLNNVSKSIGSLLTPAGFRKSVSLISTQYL
jgi:branched-chain amino acid transport system substrate-binding protein